MKADCPSCKKESNFKEWYTNPPAILLRKNIKQKLFYCEFCNYLMLMDMNSLTIPGGFFVTEEVVKL